MNMGERSTKLRQQRGISPAQLARRIKVSPAAIGLIESGVTRSLKAETLLRLAEALDTSPWHILWGHRPASARDESSDLYETVHPLDADTLGDAAKIVMRPLAFPAGLLAAHGADPSHCRFVLAPDGSMAPAIPAGASVVFDQSARQLRRGKRYVVRVAGELLIRRCAGYGSEMSLSADRPEPGDAPIRLTGGYDIEILGRVCCVIAWADNQ
jgi:transcriptional regulator with XRE-family HTH domain